MSTLCRVPEVRDYVLPINFAETAEAAATSARSRREARALLKAGGCLIIFPGGGVSTSREPFGPAVDADWHPFTGRLVMAARAAGSAGPVRGAEQPPVPAGQPLQLYLAPVAAGARDPEPDRQRHPRAHRRGAAVRGLGRHERSEAARRPAAGADLRHRPRAHRRLSSLQAVGRLRRLQAACRPAWTIACSSRRVWRARTGSRPSRRQIRPIIGSSISSSSLGSPLRPTLHSLLAAMPDVCGLCSCRSACIPIPPREPETRGDSRATVIHRVADHSIGARAKRRAYCGMMTRPNIAVQRDCGDSSVTPVRD